MITLNVGLPSPALLTKQVVSSAASEDLIHPFSSFNQRKQGDLLCKTMLSEHCFKFEL